MPSHPRYSPPQSGINGGRADRLVGTAPVIAEISDKGGLLSFSPHRGAAGVALASVQLLTFWLADVLVRARRQAASLAARSAALQRQAEQATAAERARIARELHDIVAHHLSVVVLHSAGAWASGKPAGADLEKIENSARQAVGETRRLLGVLRDPDEEAGLAPRSLPRSGPPTRGPMSSWRT